MNNQRTDKAVYRMVISLLFITAVELERSNSRKR